MAVSDAATDAYEKICSHEGLTADQLAVQMRMSREDTDVILAHLTANLGDQTLVSEDNGVYRRFVKARGKWSPSPNAKTHTAHRVTGKARYVKGIR